MVDVSEGGLGLQSPIFLPRSARLLVLIDPGNIGHSTDELAVRLVVRRCRMFDVKPTYHVGLQYLEPGVPEIQELVRIAEVAKAQCDSEGSTNGAASSSDARPEDKADAR